MSEQDVRRVLRAALRHMRHFRAWDYSDSMAPTIRRIEKILAAPGTSDRHSPRCEQVIGFDSSLTCSCSLDEDPLREPSGHERQESLDEDSSGLYIEAD